VDHPEPYGLADALELWARRDRIELLEAWASRDRRVRNVWHVDEQDPL
jgi:hypothetical protein